MVPSSSAHCAIGSTTSARDAVSDRNMSATTSRSSPPIRPASAVASGAETSGFAAITISPFTRPPSSANISTADRPGCGRLSASTPQIAATSARCTGLSSLR